jgi:hypothetical protein
VSFAHSSEHQQVVKTKHQDHSIKNAKEEIFIQGVVDEIISGSQHEQDIGLLLRFYSEVIGNRTVIMLRECNEEVFMMQSPVDKRKTITKGRMGISAFGFGNVKIYFVNRLIKKFYLPFLQ